MFMTIFTYDDYRDYLKEYFNSLPAKGYGKLAEVADFCSMNPATLSLVMRKDRDFTLDQAHDVCRYLGLSDLEIEYFLVSVQFQRSGRPPLRARLKDKLLEIRSKSQDVKERLAKAKVLDENTKSKFYSQWYYSAIRIATSIPQYNHVDLLSERLQIPRHLAQKAIDFLLEHGLIQMTDKGLQSGVQSTHLGADSPLVSRHHTNWRMKTIEKMDLIKSDEFHFTSPVSIATKDMPRVREIWIKAVEEAFKVIDVSPEEELACINIDWFRF